MTGFVRRPAGQKMKRIYSRVATTNRFNGANMFFVDFALPRKRSLTACRASTAASSRGFCGRSPLRPICTRPFEGLELFMAIGRPGTGATACARQDPAELHRQPVEAATSSCQGYRYRCITVPSRFCLPPCGASRMRARSVASHLEEVTGEPLTRELAEANDGFRSPGR